MPAQSGSGRGRPHRYAGSLLPDRAAARLRRERRRNRTERGTKRRRPLSALNHGVSGLFSLAGRDSRSDAQSESASIRVHSATLLLRGFCLFPCAAYCAQKCMCRGGRWNLARKHGTRRDVRPIDGFHGVVIAVNGCAVQRESGKYALGPRVGQDLGVHLPVSIRGSVTSHRSGCSRGITAHLELAREQVLHALVVLEDHHQVNAFHADLQTPASTFYIKEGWSAPPMLGAASGDTAATFGSEDESALHQVRHNGNAFSVIDNFLGNALVWRGHHLAQHVSRLGEAVINILLGLVCPA